MGKLIFGKTQYKNFGNCFTISNGLCELYVTTDVGPRIIKFNPIGKENIMFEDVERVMKKKQRNACSDLRRIRRMVYIRRSQILDKSRRMARNLLSR